MYRTLFILPAKASLLIATLALVTLLLSSNSYANQETVKQASTNSAAASISLSPSTNKLPGDEPQYVFDVVIHQPEEMEKLLTRIEQLSSTYVVNKSDPSLALVLHGPEISFFARENYSKYMKLVDRAAALDEKGIIEVKVCDTMIQALDLEKSDLPDFVEHVPFGPAEVNRLIEQGFIRM